MSTVEIQSFGLEFGPNFFIGHFFSDNAGEKHLHTSSINENQWLEYHARISKAGMPLFGLVHTADWTLVPSAVFSEERAADFLRFNTAFSGTGAIAYDHILPLDCVLVYPSDLTADTWVTNHFPGLELRHAGGVLLEILQRKQDTMAETAIYIHQIDAAYHISVFKEGRLELTNYIDAPHTEDIRYYTLYTMKQLDVAHTKPIYLLGQAGANTELRKGLEKYCPRVDTLRYADTSSYAVKDTEHFIALNAHRCG